MVYTQGGRRRKHKQDVLSIGVKTPNHLPHNSIRSADGFTFAMRPGDSRLQLRENVINLGPDSLPPGGLAQNDVFFDFRLTGSGVHTLTEITLNMTVRNTNPALGRAVIPLLPYFFFNRMEFQSNGSFTDDTLYPWQWYLRHTHAHQREKLKQQEAEWIGMETASSFSRGDPRTTWNCYDEDGIAIAAGESRQYFLPIYSFLSTSSLFLPSKQQDPRIRSYLASNPIRSDNDPLDLAGTPLRLEGALMILKGIIYEIEILNNLAEHYSTFDTMMPTIVHERQVIDIKNATQGVELSDLALTSLNGEYVGFFFWLQRGNATREKLYNSNNTWTAIDQGWLPLDKFSLKDSSGNPIGFNQIPGGYVKSSILADSFPNCDMNAMKDVYFFAFARDLMASLVDGRPSGGMDFDSNFTCSVVPGPITANPATLNFQLHIFGLRKAIFVMTKEGLFAIKKQ